MEKEFEDPKPFLNFLRNQAKKAVVAEVATAWANPGDDGVSVAGILISEDATSFKSIGCFKVKREDIDGFIEKLRHSKADLDRQP